MGRLKMLRIDERTHSAMKMASVAMGVTEPEFAECAIKEKIMKCCPQIYEVLRRVELEKK